MADYTVALGVRPIEIDVARPFALKSQMMRDEISRQQAMTANRLTEARLGEIQDRKSALSQYQETGDLKTLGAHPDLMDQMLSIRAKMDSQSRARHDSNVMENALAARRVAGIPAGPERDAAWQKELKIAHEAGRLPDHLYESYSKTPPNGLLLRNVMMQGISLEKQLDLEAKRAKAAEPPAAVKTAQYAAGLDVSDPAQKRKYDILTMPKTSINMPKTETEFAKARGKSIAENVGKVEEATDVSRELLASYDQITELLSNPDVYTGTLAEPIAALKKAGETMFGLDMKGVADAEVAQKVGDAAVAQMKKAMDDPRMTDQDREFYRSIPANISDSPEGIQLSREILAQATEHKQTSEQKLYDFLDLYPDNKSKAWREWRQWNSKQRIWTPELMARVKEVAKKKATKRGPGAGMDALKERYPGLRLE